VIVSPYQRKGHGCTFNRILLHHITTLYLTAPHAPAELYNAIYAHVLSRPDVAELTVEDPAEAFEDLRDRNDLKMLLSNARFMEEGFGSDAIGGGVSHGGGRVVKGKNRGLGAGVGRGKGKMGPPAEKWWTEKWRKDLKIAGVSTSCCAVLVIPYGSSAP
jgi:hypothetical protein